MLTGISNIGQGLRPIQEVRAISPSDYSSRKSENSISEVEDKISISSNAKQYLGEEKIYPATYSPPTSSLANIKEDFENEKNESLVDKSNSEENANNNKAGKYMAYLSAVSERNGLLSSHLVFDA